MPRRARRAARPAGRPARRRPGQTACPGPARSWPETRRARRRRAGGRSHSDLLAGGGCDRYDRLSAFATILARSGFGPGGRLAVVRDAGQDSAVLVERDDLERAKLLGADDPRAEVGVQRAAVLL